MPTRQIAWKVVKLNNSFRKLSEQKWGSNGPFWESGTIEQDADVVMLLHREDYYHTEPGYEKTNTADIIIAKQRNGPTGQIEVTWNPQWTRFTPHSQAREPFGV